MNIDNKIGAKEAILFILIVTINKIILNLPKSIIRSTSTGAIVNLILTGLIVIFFVLIVSCLFKNFQNDDIIDISEYVGGKFLKSIIGILYIVFFSTIICTVILQFISLIKVVYFPKSPFVFVVLFFVAAMSIANYFGNKSIIKTNSLIVPVIMFSLIIMFFGITNQIDINRLFPIFGKDYKSTFIYGLQNIYAFGGVGYVFFLMPFLKNKKDFKKVSISAIVFSIFFLIFITALLLLTFPFISHSEEMVSVYLLVRVLEFGEFLQRTDALFIFLWILSSFSYLSITLMFVLNTFKKVTNISDSRQMSFCFGCILFGVTLFLNNQYIIDLLEGPIYKYSILILIFFISFTLLLIANIKKKLVSSNIFKKQKNTTIITNGIIRQK